MKKLAHKRPWTLWAKALGEKSHKDVHEADKIALIRTIFILINVITNISIMSGIIRHW